MSNLLSLEEIAPGASVRFTTIDGQHYLSVRDLIMHMCQATGDYAAQIWRNMTEAQKSEVRGFLSNFQFPGRGQSKQPVITFRGALKLAMFLPGENAKKNRSVMTDIIERFLAGDASLSKEIQANAESNAPVAQMARASLLAAAGGGGADRGDALIIPSAVVQLVDDEKEELEEGELSRKRRSRMMMLEALELEEPKLRIEERRAAVERTQMENKSMEVAVQRTQMENKSLEVDVYTKLEEQYRKYSAPVPNLDDRARLMIMDRMLNLIVAGEGGGSSSQPQQQLAMMVSPSSTEGAEANSGSNEKLPFLTISNVAAEMGHRFDMAQLRSIGLRVAKAFRAKYNNQPPPKHEQYVDGGVRPVNTYERKDRDLLEAEIRAYAMMMALPSSCSHKKTHH